MIIGLGLDSLNAEAQERASAYVSHDRSPLILKQFAKLAFASEMKGEARAGRLVRWNQALTLRLLGRGRHEARQDVLDHVVTLRNITGLMIRVLNENSSESANVNVFFWPRHDIAAVFAEPGLQAPSPCRARIETDQQFYIQQASIFISTDSRRLRRHCIVEELTQILGLMNDSALILNSIFRDGSRRNTLSKADRVVLGLLYHPAIQAGMRQPQAMKTIDSVFEGKLR